MGILKVYQMIKMSLISDLCYKLALNVSGSAISNNVSITSFLWPAPREDVGLTRLLGRPQPQMYPPVALNQYTWVNRTHKHLKYIYMLQGPTNILKFGFYFH